MQIYEYKKGTPVSDEPLIVALGYFDGVHKGHRHLISLARALADSRGLPLAVFTFKKDESIKENGFLYTTEQKLDILASLGVDIAIVADFKDIASTTPEDFINGCLIKDMCCVGAVCGFDFRFGRGAAADAQDLKRALHLQGRDCEIASEVQHEGKKISTTLVKEALLSARLDLANALLQTPYFIEGEVKRGDGRGHSLGFPTVNTEFHKGQLVAKRGVYRSVVDIGGKLYNAITNIGTCPTFGEREIHAESYIIDFDGDLYSQKLRIFLLGYLRGEKKFSSQKELIMQINVDKNTAIRENGELKWQVIGQS